MPNVTREQWETSDCLLKKTWRSYGGDTVKTYFNLCGPCQGRIEDPSSTELCGGAPRPPCKSMKEGEPTVHRVFQEFLDTVEPKNNCTQDDIESAIDLLSTSMSRCWECHQCQYWEAPSGGCAEAFASTHGVSWIEREIPSFCSYFVIRKCMMSESEKRRCYTVMSKLTDFMFERQYIATESKKEIKKAIARCRAVNSEKICRALHALREQGYWKSLEETGAAEAGEEFVEDSDVESYGEGTFGDEMPLEVKEVKEEGWIFIDPCGGYSSGEDNDQDEVLLRLPKDVAKLGRKGMTISCMNLHRRYGIWSPYSPYDSSQVCANVYPPE